MLEVALSPMVGTSSGFNTVRLSANPQEQMRCYMPKQSAIQHSHKCADRAHAEKKADGHKVGDNEEYHTWHFSRESFFRSVSFPRLRIFWLNWRKSFPVCTPSSKESQILQILFYSQVKQMCFSLLPQETAFPRSDCTFMSALSSCTNSIMSTSKSTRE